MQKTSQQIMEAIMLKKWIIDQLTNDEVSTDEEMIKWFMSEGGLTKKEATKWVSLRDSIRLENLY